MIRYYDIGPNHAIARGGAFTSDFDLEPPHQLPSSARWWWRKWALSQRADGGVVVRQGGVVVGFCRWRLWAGRELCFSGTWVSAPLRHQGVGVQMWRRVLQRIPYDACAIVTTQGGRRLVERLQREFPERAWDVTAAMLD